MGWQPWVDLVPSDLAGGRRWVDLVPSDLDESSSVSLAGGDGRPEKRDSADEGRPAGEERERDRETHWEGK
jgi:hypothetical protein